MWYLASLFILVALLSSCAIVGTAVCRLLPLRIRPYATFAFAPLLGLAVFVLLATATAWISGFRTWFCLPATLALVLAALRLSGNPGKALKLAAAVSAYSVLPSLGWLFSILRYEAFSPFNDVLAYLTHAQWLQTHAFREAAPFSENYPGLANVISSQVMGFRIGASCVLGWVQAACGVQWSYLVYPAVVLLAMIAGAWALAGTAFFVVRRGRLLCLLGGAVIVTTFNGFSFGANEGFFHQTYGVTLGFATLSLLGMYAAILRRQPILPRQLIPGALLAAATVCSYPEFAPFLALAAAAFLVGAVLFRLARPITVARFALVLCLLTAALVNLELIRTFRSLFNDTHAQVGSPVVWTPIQFLAHTCGFLTGAWEGGDWVFSSALLTTAALLLVIAAAALLLVRYRGRLRLEGLAPALCVSGACLLAFLYFRYFGKSPWPQGVGQSWDQFKLSNWAAIFVLFLLVCGLASARYAPRWVQSLVIAWLLIWQVDGLFLNYRMAEARTWAIRTETGVNYAPFDVYRQLCDSAVLKPAEPVSLQLGADHFKSRELFVYFWPDRPLISDWSNDDYFAAAGFKGNTAAAAPSMWTVELSTPGRLRPTEQRVGRISLLRPPLKRIQLLQTTGGYDEDTDAENDSLRWTAKSLTYHFKTLGAGPLRLLANFTYLPVSPGRRLRILVDEGAGAPRILQSIDIPAVAWTPFVSAPFEIHSPEFSLTFECDQPPVRLGNGDPRMASFLIKNLELNVVE